MATTQALLRSEAPRSTSPSEVLARLNDVLVADTPDKMFATCTFIVLDPAAGHIRFANAGHPLPYLTSNGRTDELRARGMPLGLLPDSHYELADAVVPRGSRMLLHSDGLAEAHSEDGDMFGLPRIVATAQRCRVGEDLIEALLSELDSFTGPDWEQEDDITLVTLERL
jgi:serine phosphatase RsbU (regulator of sigma subunit)